MRDTLVCLNASEIPRNTEDMWKIARRTGFGRGQEGFNRFFTAFSQAEKSIDSSGIISLILKRPSVKKSLYKNNSNINCQLKAKTSCFEKYEDGSCKQVYVPWTCKQWICLFCGPDMKKKLQRNLLPIAAAKKLDRLITLTKSFKGVTQDQAVGEIKKYWVKFRNQLQRFLKMKSKKRTSYFACIELFKSGYPHIHLLVDTYVPQNILSMYWRKASSGGKVHVKQLDSPSKAVYYVTKHLDSLILPKGIRRVMASRNIKLQTPKIVVPHSSSSDGWVRFHIENTSLHDQYDSAIRQKLPITNVRLNKNTGKLKSFEVTYPSRIPKVLVKSGV